MVGYERNRRRDSPPDGRATTVRRVLVALALVAALALGGAVVADVAAADEDGNENENEDGEAALEVDLEREGHDLIVTLSESGVDSLEEVRIDVEDADVAYAEEVGENESRTEFAFDVTDPDEGDAAGVSLTNANVTVSVTGDGETASADHEGVPLHAVTVSDDLPVWTDATDDEDEDEDENESESDKLRVPLNASATTGVAAGDTVAVSGESGSESDSFQGTIRGNGSQLELEREGVAALGAGEPIELAVLAESDGPAVFEAPDEPIVLEPELRSIDDRLSLWYPGLETDQEYDVVAEGSDGRYVATVEPNRPGVLGLSSLSPQGSIDVEVVAANDAGDLEIDESLEYDGPFGLTAVADGSTLSFDEAAADLEVTGAVLEPNDSTAHTVGVDGMDEEGTLELDLESAGIDSIGEDDTVLVQTVAGTATVELVEPDTADTDEAGMVTQAIVVGTIGSPVVLSLVLGLGIGIAGVRIGGQPTTAKVALSALTTFCLALAGTIGVLYVTGNVFPIDPVIHGVGAGGVLLGTAVAPLSYALLGNRSSGADVTPGFTADVTISDGSGKLSGQATVHYREAGDGDRNGSSTIVGGSGTLSLPDRGTWELVAKYGSDTSDVETVSRRNSSAVLTVTSETTLTVVDASDRDPVPGATVRTADGASKTTGKRGTVTIEPPNDGSSSGVEVEIGHEADKYESRTKTVRFGRNDDRTVELEPRTGRVKIVSRIDGVATESMALRVTPEDGERFLQQRSKGFRTTTGRDGTATRDDVMVGRYRVEIPSPGNRSDLFAGGEADLVVRENGTATAEVDARFTWSLSQGQRDRIADVRRDLESLATQSGRDTSIPEYYASVVESMLESVESMPEAGHLFVGGDHDPDAVADAILEAAAETTEAINDAMTTKRNVDLFAACADMPDAGVRWRGEYDLAELLDRLSDDPTSQRNQLKQRYEDVAGQIEDARRDVSEIAPAREMHNRAWDLVGDADRGDQAIVTAYASLLVLDAVEQLLEHDSLRERLSRTVF
ncbi:hypothetical protein SAMN05444422_10521 [Halobiforma haloterrestris]|uniref:Uncharacterized protein n=1 Tax=Natronobacterium haloterrestre TaxID=148448 RepID=A0A1I1GTZ7_NATHA|nr:hypothetical protein [Halobiforma haloterrestris]SFC14981.1 hypothetical protein SAMN05444422_10521 [Halobiforma haloterrestris]